MDSQNPSLSLSSPPPPPPTREQQQPPLKKPKMSSTTTTTSDDDTSTTTKPRRYKRRKVAIFFAYCGVGYQGMQKNPGAKTIEGDLEEALFFSGAVTDADRGQPKRFDWARSARTDKGVSAVGQVVSGRFYVDPPGFVHRLQSFLSDQIRVFGYKRVTNSFNAKKFCDRRRYVYLLPVFALDCSCHRDRESVMASLGSGNELAKCFECSERGRKVVGLMGNKKDCEFRGLVQSGISSNSRCALLNSEGLVRCGGVSSNGVVEESLEGDDVGVVGSEGLVSSKNEVALGVEVKDLENDGVVEESLQGDVGVVGCDGLVSTKNEVALGVEVKDLGNDCVVEESLEGDVGVVGSEGLVSSKNEAALLTSEVKGFENDGGEEGRKEKRSEFKYGEEERKRFNRILKYYEGTHNFHNFTTRTKAEDPSAKRYIVSFEANTVLTIGGIEFVKCEVIGQSFMLHQIRKMMGLAVAVMRNFAPESIYERAFDQDFRINVPTAPEVGLYLDECFFTSYNNKWKDTHEEVSMKDYAEEAEEFKLKYIYSHVANMEHKEGSVAVWLHSLNHRNYPDLCPPNEVKEAANGEVERAVSDEVKRAANDEVEKAASDEVKKSASDEVERAGNDEARRAASDEVERAGIEEAKTAAEGDAMDVLP